MRRILSLILLIALAVVSALVLANNQGWVSIFWKNTRIDLSLNLLLITLVGFCVLIYGIIHGLNVLLGMPARAREWRAQRSDKAAQTMLRQALALYFGGRYTRAHRSAMRALTLREQTDGLAQDHEFGALAHLMAAGSLHRLQDHVQRDQHLDQALALSAKQKSARPIEEGARLLSAEWALDDRDAPLALERLSSLHPGVARRTQALRLKLQAARLSGANAEAMRTARLLAKHQAFTPTAARGLIRSLAENAIRHAKDADQLRKVWAEFDASERKDALIVAYASGRLSALGDWQEARQWIKPFVEKITQFNPEEREAISAALVASLQEPLPVEWVSWLETAVLTSPQDPVLSHVLGRALFARQLWGKAQQHLQSAAQHTQAPIALRRDAWLHLARIAQQQNQPDQAAHYFEQGAQL